MLALRKEDWTGPFGRPASTDRMLLQCSKGPLEHHPRIPALLLTTDSSRPARLPGSSPAEVETDAAQSKIYGASWHMIMSQALEPPPGPAEPSPSAPDAPAPPAAPGGLITSPSRGSAPTANGTNSASGEDTSASSGMFDRITRRLVRCLLSGSHSLVCAAARTVGVMAEARAWFHALSGGHGHEAEPEAVRRAMRSLHGWLLMLSGDDGVSGCGRAAAIEVRGRGVGRVAGLCPAEICIEEERAGWGLGMEKGRAGER